MDDQLDNDLKNRIREVFDHYEDNTANEGWLLLREKFPEEEEKRPMVWLWWASTAAGLLLFLAIGVWMLNDKQTTNINTAAIPPVKQHTRHQQAAQVDTASQIAANTAAGNSNAVDTAVSAQNNIAQNQGNSHKKPVINNPAVNAAAVIQNSVAVFTPSTNAPAAKQPQVNQNNSINSTVNQFAAQQPAAANKQPIIVATPGNKADSVKTAVTDAGKQQYAANPAVAPTTKAAATFVTPNTANQQPTQVKPSSANAMATMLAADNLQTSKTKDKVADDKKVKFGIYAATFFNYAKGSANQVNAGAGFTSDIRLSKNLKLSTGVALAQNTLKYNTSVPPTASAANAVTFAVAAQDNKLVPASSFPVFKNYNASLVGLDVPINLKYEFNPEKTDAYFSAGLSSGTFINEAYTTSYGIPHSSLLSGATQQTSEETNRQSFNGFYFARTLNISVGVGTALGKNRLIIEPFLKYPLQGMGAQQIKFGAGGLNLKFNFAGGKR
ncbi:hypothetical protein PQ469_20895 [Mucilaginibacter sp. KACC 22773]|uniref:hypothetical protein n=1 Tax=Mucilaginibacter sp. KACC 22773 TaxID=3025671 RepID=UPI0023661A81|nr:hypothetical protein [Mucilaginibacter sp. KACC 22773]WDF76350.1 hypothetical protein PQ469_20895 [Mucilaginibacter sp. KACC 22773]